MKKSLFLAFCICFLWGCSGGGGSDGPSYSITLDKTSITMSSAWKPLSVVPQSIIADFNGDGLVVGYPPGVPQPSWLNVYTESLGATRVRVGFAVPFTSLSPGTYSSTVRLVTGKADGSSYITKDIPVTLTVQDGFVLSIADNANVLGGHVGGDVFSEPLTVTLDTAGLRWSATSAADWLDIEPKTGTGPATLTVSAKASGAGAGWHDGVITVSAVESSQTATTTVKLGLDAPRWWIKDNGVAFSDLGSTSTLSRSIRIATSKAFAAGSFSAQSNASWLTATITDKQIALSADTAGLADGFYATVVSVSSNNSGETKVHQLPVGLYVNRTVALTEQAFPIFADSAEGNAVYGKKLADPIRPIVYIYSQQLSRLEAYNIYTGEKTKSLASSYRFWGMSDDANSLSFREYDDTGWTSRFRRYDLLTDQWLDIEETPTARTTEDFNVLDGVKLVTYGGEVRNHAGDKQLLANSKLPNNFYLLNGGSGERLFAYQLGISPGQATEVRAFQPYVFELAAKMVIKPLETGSVINGGTNVRLVANDDSRIWDGLEWVNYDKSSGFGSAGVLAQPTCDTCFYNALAIDWRNTAMIVWDHFTGYYASQSYLSRYNSAGELTTTSTMPAEAPQIGGEYDLLLSNDGIRFASVQDGFTTNTRQAYLYIGNR